MANDEISDIANTVALGVNTIKSCIAGEASLKAGMGVYLYNPTGAKAIEGVESMSGLFGVVKEHYATGMDSALANNAPIEIVTQGIVPVFCDDPGIARQAGGLLMLSGTLAGSFGWHTQDFMALSGYAPVIRTIVNTANGDTVTIGEIL